MEMVSNNINRRLSGVDQEGKQFELNQSDLLGQAGPIVVLGDAGMGKTTLLKEIGKVEGYKYVNAMQLVRSHDPAVLLGDATRFVIDALDELAVRSEGDAVDAVLTSLEMAEYPDFILSCRVADWRSATSLQSLKDSYTCEPQELFLEPIRRDQARNLLARDIGGDLAEAVLTHFQKRGLDGLFGNPQTLMLVRSVADNEILPDSKVELFELSVKKMWTEHSQAKTDSSLSLLTEKEALDAAGGVFSLLLLTGKRAVSRLPNPKVDEDDLPISEAKLVAKMNNLQAVLTSRLFTSNVDGDPDRFSYSHRSVGEFLAARWLTRKADTDRKRRRLLKLFRGHGLVPTCLRGLHAWLAQDARLFQDVVSIDPMGIVEFGDTYGLTDEQARALLESLFALSNRDPHFGYEMKYSLRGIARPALCSEINKLILSASTPFRLKVTLLHSVSGTEVATLLVSTLRNVVLDPEASYFERQAAGNGLTKLPTADLDWEWIFHSLHESADQDSLRLAIELLPNAGFDGLPDRLIVELIVAYCGLSNRILGILWKIEKFLPCERIEPVLKILSDYLDALTGAGLDRVEELDVINLVNALCERILELGRIQPSWLWPLLSSHGSRNSPYGTGQQSLSDWFQQNVEPRQKFQRFILLEQSGPKTVMERGLNLRYTYPGLYPDESDIIELLSQLKPGTEAAGRSWKDLVRLCRHDKERGTRVRKAAVPFATDQEGQDFLERLANPVIPEWQTKQEENERNRQEKIQKEWADHRARYFEHIDDLRAGKFGYIVNPANAYLGVYSDINVNVPAHQRIENWLGEELQNAAFEGFEEYLKYSQSTPTAKEIALSFADGKRWDSAYILVASIAERIRNDLPLNDIPDDRLLAVLLEIRFSQILERARIIRVSEVVEKAVKIRQGLWETFWRLRIEPQFNSSTENIDGLYEFCHNTDSQNMVSKLAREWLERFPDLSHRTEVELIDCLIVAKEFDFLKCYVHRRRTRDAIDDARRSDLDAVAFIADYDSVHEDLSRDRGQSPDFLWNLRGRFGRQNDEDSPSAPLSPAQLAWTIRTFRPMYQPKPLIHRRVVKSAHDRPAPEYIGVLINRLGGLTSIEAIEELAKLRDEPNDGYTGFLNRTFAEQAQKVVEEKYSPLDIHQIASVLTDGPPNSLDQLQAVMLEQLILIQGKICAHPVDWYKDFYNEGVPKDEEECRDMLLKMFGDFPNDVLCEPEGHLVGDRRTDIRCTFGKMMLPIEVKGQWHKDLWHAADTQLSKYYSTDWRAERRGIYIVLWFGKSVPKNKRLRYSGEDNKQSKTAEDLRLGLIENSVAAKQGNIEVFVLDLEKPL